MAKTPVAVHFNLFPVDSGIAVMPFTEYDADKKTCTELGRFVIPWHELHGFIDRLERIEQHKLEDDL